MGRRKTAKHAQRGTGFDLEVLSLCRPTRGGRVSDCNLNWKVGEGERVIVPENNQLKNGCHWC